MAEFHPSLKDVHPDHTFYVRDGPKLKNLYELERELRRMSDGQFKHHVNDAKNDFYNWIFHIVKDEKLASQLAQVKERVAMADVIERRITQLEEGEKPTIVEKVVTKVVEKIVKVAPVVKAAPKPAPKPAPKLIKPKLTITFTPRTLAPPAVLKKAKIEPVKKAVQKKELIKAEKKFVIPKVTLPNFIPPVPVQPAIAPLPLSFEEVEQRIRAKVGEEPIEPLMPDPITESPDVPEISHVHEKKWHHHVKHHVKTHAVHYGIAAGILLGMFLAKYFI